MRIYNFDFPFHFGSILKKEPSVSLLWNWYHVFSFSTSSSLSPTPLLWWDRAAAVSPAFSLPIELTPSFGAGTMAPPPPTPPPPPPMSGKSVSSGLELSSCCCGSSPPPLSPRLRICLALCSHNFWLAFTCGKWKKKKIKWKRTGLEKTKLKDNQYYIVFGEIERKSWKVWIHIFVHIICIFKYNTGWS